MAEGVGRILEILEIPEVWRLYRTSIRQMQPAELVRRLEGEKVSTRGHMPELRGRLLRLQVRKSHPRLEVPWYPEDDALPEQQQQQQQQQQLDVAEERGTGDDDAVAKFFRVTRYQERELNRVAAAAAAAAAEKGHEKREDDLLRKYFELSRQQELELQRNRSAAATIERRQRETTDDTLDVVIKRLETALQEYLEQQEEISQIEREQLAKTARKVSVISECEKVDESEIIFDENLDEEVQEAVESDDSIVKINYDEESFEKLDAESTGSWDTESMWGSSLSSVRHVPEVD